MSNITKVTLIILLLNFITSCNSVKTLADDEFLLSENKVLVNNKNTSNLDVLSYINQRPNQKVLGLPLSIYVYNWAKTDYEKTLEQWIGNHPKNTNFIQHVFSEKQVGEFYRFNKKLNTILKNNGEAPVVINDKLTQTSVNTLKKYYYYKGYFDAEVSAKEIIKGNKRKIIEYNIDTKKPYIVNDIATNIESPVLKNIYNKHKDKSFVQEGKQFNRNDFIKESNRLTKLFRNSGIYYFGKNYIYFDGLIKDSISKIQNVKLVIKEKNIDSSSDVFKIQKVTKVNVYTDYSFENKDLKYTDSITYNNYTFFAHDKLNFSTKRLANTIAITPNGVYKDTERELTIKYLNEIKIFKSPINIEYIENEDGNLTANINLVPLKKWGLDAKADVTHSNIKPFGVLGKLGIIKRNTFKGLEVFNFSTQFSFLNISEDTSSPDFNYFGLNAWEFGANVSFDIPRILFPLNTNKIILNRMRPTTNIGLSTSFQKNIGLDRQNFTGNITYNWTKNKKVKHQLELINVQYINNINSNSYFKVFDSELVKLSQVAQDIVDVNSMNNDGEITNTSAYINYVLNPLNNYQTTQFNHYKTVQQVKERKKIITEDILVPTMSYSYTYNSKSGINDNHFSFLNTRIVSAGTITSLLTKQKTENKKELFGLPIAQYIKAEVEYKKYWNLSNQNNLVFRTFIGAAFPFGNSTEIPFSRSYRAGGSNDVRAWKTFDLGPGSSLSNLDFNIGNLKLVANFEYRFKIINSFYSALFVDFGNVWDLTNSELTSKTAKFKGFNSIEEIAVGSGFGLRYDFDFLIFRIDYGLKTYEPYLKNKGWFRNYNFNHGVFNFGINYPF